MKSKKPHISIILPCRNEEKTIAKLVARLKKPGYEIIVVDNGSTDKTSAVAKKAGAVVYRENRVDSKGIGYGYAHLKGMRAARGEYLVAMDGDGTYPAQDIEKIVTKMKEQNLDFMLCDRFPLKNMKAISPIRRLGIMVLNLEMRILFGYPMKDTLSGMWAMKKNCAAKMCLKEGGWDLSPEIKIEAIINPQIKVGNFHISHGERAGESKQQIWQTGIGHLLYILKRRLGLTPKCAVTKQQQQSVISRRLVKLAA